MLKSKLRRDHQYLLNNYFNFHVLDIYFKKYIENKYLRFILATFSFPFYIIKNWNNININGIELVVTTKCNLNCKDCVNLMQYYDNPYNIEIENLVYDVKQIIDIVDNILELRVIGGEPLLNTELPKLLNFLAHQKKILTIVISTNGTVSLNQDLINSMKNEKIRVKISKYDTLNTKMKVKNFIQELEDNDINIEIKYHSTWSDFGDLEFRNRNQEEMIEIFENCKSSYRCGTILNGEYHLCPRSAHATSLGLVPKDKESFMNIRLKDESKRKMKKNLKRFLKTKPIGTCNYCDAWDMEIREIAKQK
ncbi:MAG: radical SAM protein [Methanobrevibacter sp.]|nr:radical SAM protein [Candidatus Methanovirga meridionalis]